MNSHTAAMIPVTVLYLSFAGIAGYIVAQGYPMWGFLTMFSVLLVGWNLDPNGDNNE